MREWSAARQHVQSMKATDPRGAERLNKDITEVRCFNFCSICADVRHKPVVHNVFEPRAALHGLQVTAGHTSAK